MEREITLSLRSLKIGYKSSRRGQTIVHEGIDANLYRGEVTSLMGLNGAGKSTLLRTICGFQPALAGEVIIAGQRLEGYSQSEISQLIGVVLTEQISAGGITLRELVALGRYPYTGLFGKLSSRDNEIVGEAMQAVGIAHKAESYVSELSDGERQKAMIAKVLAQQSPIIILDEPTAFLDVTSRIELMLLLRKLATEQNKTILLSTHDLDTAIELSDKIWLQRTGENLHCGTPDELIESGVLPEFFSRNEVQFDPSKRRLTALLG